MFSQRIAATDLRFGGDFYIGLCLTSFILFIMVKKFASRSRFERVITKFHSPVFRHAIVELICLSNSKISSQFVFFSK